MELKIVKAKMVKTGKKTIQCSQYICYVPIGGKILEDLFKEVVYR